MSLQKTSLRSKQGPSSVEDHTSVSDLKKLMEKRFGELMSAIQGVNGRVMKLESGMDLLLVGTKSDMIDRKAHGSGPRCLKLVFNNKISLPVLNGEEIKGEGGKYLEVVLVDDVTGSIVEFGPEASAHVEIVALEGDSDQSEGDTWVVGNYKNKVTCENEGKKPVLVGQMKLKLNKGIGSLVNLKFRNSSHHNSGMFKLGAKVIDSSDGTLVKDAITESFFVKDFREKYKQKHYPPSLSDEIWRLENIQKGGAIHKRVKEKVKTVEDFLLQLLKDPAGLQRSLCLPEKKWKATVQHAQTCTVNEKVYCSINSQEKKGVVFNVVGKILGLIKDGNYVNYDMLLHEDKVEAEKLFATTMEQKEEVKDFSNEDSLLQYLTCQSTAVSTNSPRPEINVSSDVETRIIVETDQANTDASSQNALSSEHPNTGTVCPELGVNKLCPPDNPTVCTATEAQLYVPICIDQSNIDKMNINATSQEVLISEHNGGDSASYEAGTSVLGRFDFESILTPYNDHLKDLDDLLQDLCPTEGEVEACEPSGSIAVQDMQMGTKWFSSPDKQNLIELESLWTDDHPEPSFSFPIDNCLAQVHDGQFYSNKMSSEVGLMDCLRHLRHAVNRRWNILLSVIKWCLKLKRAAFKGNRHQKKLRIS